MSGPSPWGPPADSKQGRKLQVVFLCGSLLAPLNGSSGTVTVSAGERFEGNVGLWPLHSLSSRDEIRFYSLLFLYSFLYFLFLFCQLACTPLLFFIHHLCLFPHLTHLFVSISLFSPPQCPFSSFPAWRLSLLIFSTLFFLSLHPQLTLSILCCVLFSCILEL